MRGRERDLNDQWKAEERQEMGKTHRGLPPSKRYRVDPTYCRTPKGYCMNPSIGLPVCEYGEEGLCYKREVCASQTTEEAEARLKEEMKAAMKHAEEVAKRTPEEEWDRMVDAFLSCTEKG